MFDNSPFFQERLENREIQEHTEPPQNEFSDAGQASRTGAGHSGPMEK